MPISSFRRQFHKARKVCQELAQEGGFQLNLSFSQDGGLTSSISTPDDDQTIRLVVLMRPLLSRDSEFSCERIWTLIKDQFGDLLDPEVVEYADEHLEKAKEYGLTIEGEEITAESIYHTVADGEVFRDHEQAQEALQRVYQRQPLGHIYWDAFYKYHLDMLRFASRLHGITKSLEGHPEFDKLLEGKRPDQERCIYCLSTSAAFNTQEHVYPESLGNNEVILPRGYVCDTCNNAVSQVEGYALNSLPLSLLRTYVIYHTKKGKLPKAEFDGATIDKTAPRDLRIITGDDAGEPEIEELPDGQTKARFTFKDDHVMDHTKLGRALLKMGLGMIAYENGHERACGSRYDEARSYIVSGDELQNNLLISTEIQPRGDIQSQWQFYEPRGTLFSLRIYGCTFVFNLEPEPKVKLHPKMADVGFQIFPLSGEEIHEA